MHAARQLEPSSEANFTQRDKKLLANAPYAKATIPTAYQRHIVNYHRKEAPGTIVVDTDARYLYYVMPDKQGDPLRRDRRRRGAVVVRHRQGRPQGRVADLDADGRHQEAARTFPTSSKAARTIRMGARGIYLYQANKDTLFRIHGTNQPEYIGQAISSGCIRMTNEDVIDLYNRVKMGAIVVVLAPKAGDSPTNPQVATAGDPRLN